MALLANDVAAVVRDLGRERATIIGHDWGSAIAWSFAITHPETTERLIVLQTPHPRGVLRELRTNPQQLANSAYARPFQQDGRTSGSPRKAWPRSRPAPPPANATLTPSRDRHRSDAALAATPVPSGR